MTDTAVVIAGAGPTGMMLSAELTLAGVDVVVVERRPDHVIESSRAGGLHARTIEVLDQRGVVDRFLDEGQAMQVQMYAGVPIDISDFPSRHNYGLALWQSHFERIMAGWVEALGVTIRRERVVTGLEQDDGGVDVTVSDGTSLRCQYLVGCDGGRSLIRKAAGIEFPGWDPTTSWMIAEVEMPEETPPGIRLERGGVQALHRMEDGRTVRAVLTDPDVVDNPEPTLQDLKDSLVAVYGTDFGAHNPKWISRFTDMCRQAATYRQGRVLLAGDAAHVHSPQGGQGLNISVQDAVNLGWKLALVVKGAAPEDLLDTYHAERHPIGARVLRNTMAQVAVSRTDERSAALREAVAELLGMDEPRKFIGGMLSGLDVHYDLGPGHPLVGRRMPDLDVVTADGPQRVYAWLHDARPLMLNFAQPGDGDVDLSSWSDRVQFVHATYSGPWELPVLGDVPAPDAVLIRPDGYVAWAGEPGDPALLDALTTWFGPPTPT